MERNPNTNPEDYWPIGATQLAALTPELDDSAMTAHTNYLLTHQSSIRSKVVDG
jgi:hypothetical protein